MIKSSANSLQPNQQNRLVTRSLSLLIATVVSASCCALITFVPFVLFYYFVKENVFSSLCILGLNGCAFNPHTVFCYFTNSEYK